MKIAIPAGTKLTISSGTKQLAPDDFSPLQLPNLLAWYDASDSGTIDDSTDSGRVEQWSDKSGNNYHLTQTTLADKPYTGRTINGLPAVDFRAAQELERTDTFGVTGNPALTICFICELDTTTGRIITMDGSASASIGIQSDASWRHNDGSNIFATPPTGETLIFTARRRSGDTYADSEMRYKRADAAFSSVSSGSSTPNLTGTNTHLGSGNATGYLDGAIGEIIVYNSYLSDDDVTKVESYLVRKYHDAAYGADYAKGGYYNAVQKTNPLRYYRMFNDDTFDAVEFDLGRKTDGTTDATHSNSSFPGSVGPQKDISTYSRDFDAGGESTSASALSELNGSSEMSLACWVFNRNISSDGYVFGTTTTANSSTIYMWADVTGETNTNCYSFGVATSSTGRPESNSDSALQGVWQHVVGTMNGANRAIYVDGILQGTKDAASTTTVQTQSENMTIGDWIANGAGFDGYIADVAIWDRELSANESANLYKSACRLNLLTGDLQFDMSTWDNGTGATYAYGTAPDGTTTTNKLENTSGSDFSSVNQLITDDVDYNKVYTISAWIKAISLSVNESTCQVFDSGAAVNGKGGLHFNHSTQTITEFNSPEASGYEDAGGGWYRIWWSCVIDEGDKSAPRLYFYTGRSSNQIIGDSLEVWNVQVHEGIGPPAPTLDSRNFPRT